MEDKQKLMRPLEIAGIFGVTKQTVKNWISRGVLRHTLIEGEYFVPREDVEALIQQDFMGVERRTEQLRQQIAEEQEALRQKRADISDAAKFQAVVKQVTQDFLVLGTEYGGLKNEDAQLVNYILRGMNTTEIAKITGLSLPQVRRGIEVAMNRLQTCVQSLRQIARTQKDSSDSKYSIPISQLELPSRAQNALLEAKILTVGDLMEYSRRDLMSVKGCSQKTIQLLADIVENQLGLKLKD